MFLFFLKYLEFKPPPILDLITQFVEQAFLLFQGEGALAIGTQVSAKYKGAFCEAKVRSVDKQVKCRVTFKFGLGSTTISDKDIKTDKPLVQGASVLAKHPDKQEYCEAIVKEIKVSQQLITSIGVHHNRFC